MADAPRKPQQPSGPQKKPAQPGQPQRKPQPSGQQKPAAKPQQGKPQSGKPQQSKPQQGARPPQAGGKPQQRPAGKPAPKTGQAPRPAPKGPTTQGPSKKKPAAKSPSTASRTRGGTKHRSPGSSLNVKLKQRTGESSVRISKSKPGSDAMHSTRGGRGGGRARESIKPGFFRLSVKFTIAIAITIGLVLGLVGFLIYQGSRSVIDEQINEGGFKFARALGAIHAEYYEALDQRWTVYDLQRLRFTYDKLVNEGVDELLKRLKEQPGPLSEAERSRFEERLTGFISEAPVVNADTQVANWVKDLTQHRTNDDNVRFESNLVDILVIVPPDEPGQVSWREVMECKTYLWSMSKDTGMSVSTGMDSATWVPYRAGDPPKEVDLCDYFDGFFNSKTVRAFRAPLMGHRQDNGEIGMVGGVIVFINMSKILEDQRAMLKSVVRFSLFGIAAGVIVAYLLAMVVNRPIRRLIEDVEIVARGNLDHQTIATSTDEVGLLARAFNNMTRNLKLSVVEQLQAEAREKETAHELNIAQEIQAKLLPESLPAIKGYDLEAFYRPSKDVGGDYYDFLVVDPNHLGIIVADVSGKGIPGALVMTMTRSLVRMAAPGDLSPANTLKKVNRILAKDIRRGMFVTAMYGILSIPDRKLTLTSAGHNPAVIYRAATGAVELANPKGMALGFDKGPIFDRTLEESVIDVKAGDRVTFYTDGVVEAMNEAHEEYTTEAMVEFVKGNAKMLSLDFVNALVDELEAHRGNAPQHDDITIATFSIR